MLYLSQISHEAAAAYIAASIAAISLIIGIIALIIASRANNINKNIAKRQGVIDLHFAWRDINELKASQLIGPDVAKGVSALSLTASLWNHDVIEKLILHQSYWPSYQHLYDVLKGSTELVPGFDRKACDFLTPEITKVYDEMRQMTLSGVRQSKP